MLQSLLSYSKLLKLSAVLIINVTNNGGDRGRFVKFMDSGRMRKTWEIERGHSMKNLSQLKRENLKKFKIMY